jgi:aspartyl-tRNA(Asn)/glutamyl-tRNA(Gln) amidotransferase subunit C
MGVTREEVRRIAELARLHFEEADLARFTVQFQAILDYVEKLRQVDIEGVEATGHALADTARQTGVVREDEVRPSLASSDALSGAPDEGAGYFRVPRVL